MVGGRVRHPEILADLHAQHQLRHLPAGEEELRAHGYGLAAERDGLHVRRGRCEVALFVKFAVVGNVDLGDQAEDASVLAEGRAVVEAAAHGHRQTHRRHQVLAPGGLQHGAQGRLGAPQQSRLQKEIAAGVGCQPQLRKHQNLYAPRRRLLDEGSRGLGVVDAVGHRHFRRGHGHGDKSISHSHSSRAVRPKLSFRSRFDFPQPCGHRARTLEGAVGVAAVRLPAVAGPLQQYGSRLIGAAAVARYHIFFFHLEASFPAAAPRCFLYYNRQSSPCPLANRPKGFRGGGTALPFRRGSPQGCVVYDRLCGSAGGRFIKTPVDSQRNPPV